MADASGKLASGIARGNLNSFGSFDECLEISYVNSSKLLNIKGKYCLVSVPLFSLDSEMKRYFEKPGFKPRYVLKIMGFRRKQSGCSAIDKLIFPLFNRNHDF